VYLLLVLIESMIFADPQTLTSSAVLWR